MALELDIQQVASPKGFRAAPASLSGANKVLTVLIFFQWLIYENIILAEPMVFGGTLFLVIVFGYKLVFPFILLAIVGIPSLKVLSKARIAIYIIAFSSFLVWSLIPTLVGGNIISWLKLIPIAVFFMGVLSFFSRQPKAFNFFAKCMILYVLSALSQYVLIYLFRSYDQSGTIPLTGPFGILGNTQGQFGLPGISEPIIRLCGFWREPSIASASAYASFFLCQYLAKNGEQPYWKKLSYLCLIAGLLTLSNAGYLAIGVAGLFGFIMSKGNNKSKMIKLIFLSPFIIAIIWFALFSRSYFSENGSESAWVLAFSGVRSVSNINSADFDPSDGRLDLMDYTLSETKKNIIGKGVQVTGASGIKSPSGGLLYWMLLTGYPGLLLLLVRDGSVLVSVRGRLNKNPSLLLLAQALIVILVQHSSYGSWMDPNYMIFTSAVLLGVSNHRRF